MLAAANLNNHVLGILEKCNNLNRLKQLQAYLITLGHGETQIYAFKLVRSSVLSLSNLAYARSIFNSLSSPNVYLYTAMITAYASHPEHHSSSITLYREMVRKGRPKASHFIYPHVLKSCSESHTTEMVHTQVVKTGYGEYPVVQTALVDSYSRFSTGVKSARQVFDEMSERNVVSWTAMVSGYMRVGEIGNAVLLFEKMPDRDRDTPSWNSIIAGCTQNGLFSEAISLFRRMIDEGNKPNQVTVLCSLSAFGHTGMLQLGKCTHGYILRNGLYPNRFVSNSLVDMYGKCGSLKEARRVFDHTRNKSLTSWNSMINSFALHGQCECAIRVFEEMMEQRDGNIQPDGVTFIGLLNACTHGGLVEQGRFYFRLMIRDYKIEPQIEHYGCLIDLLGRAGLFEEAMEAISEMKIPPDEVIWGSLLNGSKVHGRVDMAEFAVKKLIGINPDNGGYRVMLANLYGEMGKWDEARKVRREVRNQNAYKTPGCSWIEIDTRVHQFYSSDKSHPKTEEVYTTLESLVGFAYEIVPSHE